MVDLGFDLVRTLRLGGHYLAAESSLRVMATAAAGRPGVLARVLAEIGRLSRARGDTEPARRAFRLGVSRALASRQPTLMIDIYLELAELLVEADRLEDALGELSEGLLLATRGEGDAATDGPPGLWQLLLRMAELRVVEGDRGGAREVAERALLHAGKQGALDGQARCYLLLGRVEAAEGQRDRARRSLQSAGTLFRRLGDRRNTAECQLLLAENPSSDPQEPEAVTSALVRAGDRRT